jgi:hypothetical protein
MRDTAAVAKSPKKFRIFHERNIWKSPSRNKRRSPAENSMITTAHSEQKTRVMRKAVCQPVYRWGHRQADPKETTASVWIAHYAVNFIQTPQRHFGVRVQKPEDIAACTIGSYVHLFRTAAFTTSDKLIAEALRQTIGAVGARAIDDNNFSATSSLP